MDFQIQACFRWKTAVLLLLDSSTKPLMNWETAWKKVWIWKSTYFFCQNIDLHKSKINAKTFSGLPRIITLQKAKRLSARDKLWPLTEQIRSHWSRLRDPEPLEFYLRRYYTSLTRFSDKRPTSIAQKKQVTLNSFYYGRKIFYFFKLYILTYAWDVLPFVFDFSNEIFFQDK